LAKVVFLPVEGAYKDDFVAFQLFKQCKIAHDARGNRYFEMDAHDEALPLMFNYQRDYFKYELWNVLNLESVNQVRMYEILKQNEWRGERIVGVDELKALLGIGEKEYKQYKDFKKRVLDACGKALKEKTDLTFTYEPIRTGRGGRITALQFTIAKNLDHVDKLDLSSFIDFVIIDKDTQAITILEPMSANEQALVDMMIDKDIYTLNFIAEPITKANRKAILKNAGGDISIIKIAYNMAKQQGNIDNLTAWLIGMVKKIRKGEVTAPVKVKAAPRQNRFVNFEQREIDFAELERLELQQLKAKMALDEVGEG